MNTQSNTNHAGLRQLSEQEIGAVTGGMIGAGLAVGAAVAYFGLHKAVETFLLAREERWYASR